MSIPPSAVPTAPMRAVATALGQVVVEINPLGFGAARTVLVHDTAF